MRDLLTLTEVAFTPAPANLRAAGILGFVRLVLNETVVIDELSLRRTRDGRLVLTWPEPRGRLGPRRIVHPRDEGARVHLEREILDNLRRRGELP